MTASKRLKIVFYDTANLFKAGFYVEGLYRRSREGRLRLAVSRTPPPRLIGALTDADWQYTLFACALFEARLGGRSLTFCIDTHDLNRVETFNDRPQGYHLPLLQAVDRYFKVNFNPQGIAASSSLAPHADRIVPVNQFIPMRPTPVLPFMLWPKFVMGGYDLGDRHASRLHRWRQRWRNLRHWVTYEQLIARRLQPKDLDLFFVTSYRGNARHDEEMQSRLRLVRGLREIAGTTQLTGLASAREMPAPYAEFGTARLKQADYLDRLGRSRIVIYTRGVDDCIASKFALYQALGACVVGNSLVNNTGLIERHPHLQAQFAFDDTDAILARVQQLVDRPQEASLLGRANLEHFDRHLSPEATADALIAEVERQLGD